MGKKGILAAIFIGALLITGVGIYSDSTPTAVSAASKKVDDDEFLFVNRSDKNIVGIYLSSPGDDKWTKNMLDKDDRPLKNGKSTDIDRPNFYGLCDIKVVYKDSTESIWRKVPLSEINQITCNTDGQCEFVRPKVKTS